MTGNGCGPKSIKYVPQRLLDATKRLLFNWFFEASCNKHDEGYKRGGNELYRWKCDIKFLMAMLRDATRVAPLLIPVAIAEAITFYLLVVLLGWIRFNYT